MIVWLLGNRGLGEGQGRRASSAERFYLNPFRAKQALRNLKRLGAGPWPYFASLIYLLGCGIFTVGIVGLFLDFCTFLSGDALAWTQLVSFELGSLMFLGGGVMECLENEVFCKRHPCSKHETTFQGRLSAVCNTAGSLVFVTGATLGFVPGWDYEANFSYFLGSLLFALGSGVQIVMWKDEP